MPPYAGYNESVNPTIDLFFANVAFRYGHSAVNQIVLRMEENGQPSDAGHLLIRSCIFDPNIREFQRWGIESVLRGMAIMKEQAVDLSVIADMRDFVVLSSGHYDMPATDVMRARDTGIPDYNTCRTAFGLPRAVAWSEITTDTDIQNKLNILYNGNISNLDAIVGALAEDHPGFATVGPLFAASLKEQFLRIRDGDRFWYENPGVLDDDDKQAFSKVYLGDLVKLNSKIITYPANPFRMSSATRFINNGPASGSGDDTAGGGAQAVSSISIFGTLRLSWTINPSANLIEFVFESNSSNWYGFGLGSTNMVNADIYFVDRGSDGNLTVTDSWSSSPGSPPSDESVGGLSNVLNISDISDLSPSRQAVVFSRAIIANDSRDADIVNGFMDCIFAFNPNSNPRGYHEGNRASVRVNFFAAGVSVTAQTSGTASLGGLKIMHGFSMFLAFAFFYPFGIYVARYHTNLKKWVEIHATLMTTVTSNVIDFVSGLVSITALAGYLSIKLKGQNPSMLVTVKFIRTCHRVFGICTFFLGCLNGWYGSVDISEGYKSREWVRWTYVALIGFTPTVLLIYGELNKRVAIAPANIVPKQLTLPRQKDPLELLPVFTWEDLNSRISQGAKWIIIEGIIYDVENFIDRHPGGAMVLRSNIGHDCTKMFSGSHSNSNRGTLERGTMEKTALRTSGSKSDDPENDSYGYIPMHKHSRFARYLLAGMAVGRLYKEPTSDDAGPDGFMTRATYLEPLRIPPPNKNLTTTSDMAKPVIAVDLDEVLCGNKSLQFQWSHEMLRDFHSYNFDQVWGGTPAEAIDKVREFYQSEHFKERMQPVPGAQEALAILKEKYDLVVVTSRQEVVHEATHAFIQKHFPGIFVDIHFANHFLTKEEAAKMKSRKKSEVCKEIGAGVLIDDVLWHASDCAGAGIKVLLFDHEGAYMWNKLPENATLPEGVTRVHDWKEVVKILVPDFA
ncbi:hypothetical protein HDU96_010403 [Phlyctochytrium bullatum]|nr:hypothetical protein HDU96_010403 [Phlyctochytrium bullatum]